MTASAIPSLKRLYSEFGERITFVMLNVREAHPGGNYPQPETYEEKLEHARAFQDLYEMPWLVAVDDIDGTLHRALDGKPNAAFVIGTDGKIVFRAHWARDERALRQALESVSQGDTLAKQQSRAMVIPVARAMGSVQPVMRVAGWQAQLDLLLAASPMAVAGLMATLFRPLAPDWRGIAAVISLGLLTVAEIASLLWWLL